MARNACAAIFSGRFSIALNSLSIIKATHMTRRPAHSRDLSRRDLLRLSALGVLGSGLSGWMPALAQDLSQHPQRRRHCILLWMPGGPSQLDTWDMKPNHGNGGEFKEAATTVPGMRFCEHLPKLGQLAEHLAIIRSLN